MKVKELIDILSSVDRESIVVVNGYEGGFEEPEPPQEIFLSANEEKDQNGNLPWWEGEYQESFNQIGKKGILLSRKYRFNKK